MKNKLAKYALTTFAFLTLLFTSNSDAKLSSNHKQLIDKIKEKGRVEKVEEKKDYSPLEAMYIKKMVEVYIRQNGTKTINKIIKYYKGDAEKTLETLLYLDNYNDRIPGRQIADGKIYNPHDQELPSLYDKLDKIDLTENTKYNANYGEMFCKRISSLLTIKKKSIKKESLYNKLSKYNMIFINENHLTQDHVNNETDIIRNLAKKKKVTIHLEHFCPSEQKMWDKYFSGHIKTKDLAKKLNYGVYRQGVHNKHIKLWTLLRQLKSQGKAEIYGCEENHTFPNMWESDDYLSRDRAFANNISKNYNKDNINIVITGAAHSTLAYRVPDKVKAITGANYAIISQIDSHYKKNVLTKLKEVEGLSDAEIKKQTGYSRQEYGIDAKSHQETKEDIDFHLDGKKAYFFE